jgi:hypothetical protein
MKNLKYVKLLFLISLGILVSIVILSCEKNASDINKNLLGTWISTDLVDTIEFRTEHDFYKTVGIPMDHFNYDLSADSIKIQYNGTLYVYVIPKNHYYKLSGNLLTIDLNHCYGFRSAIITFARK